MSDLTPRDVPITASVKEFCLLSGLCRDKVFEMIRDGTLESFKCGKLRLVCIDSYRRWVAEQIRLDKSRRVVVTGDSIVGKFVGRVSLDHQNPDSGLVEGGTCFRTPLISFRRVASKTPEILLVRHLRSVDFGRNA
jgi:hypothetical protein